MKGIGIDIVEIERLKQVIQRWGDLFTERVFTQAEIEYSMQKRFPFQHLAGRFAAKEAVMKAFGKGKITFKQIEIFNDKFGRPFCRLHQKNKNVLISIAHSDKYAIASAILD